MLDKGFAGTSIDELIAAVGITKSGFFYHFKDKSDLAKALLTRYIEREDALFDDLFRRADELNEDPLHGFLVGLKMLVRDDGRSAERASRLSRRRLLLSGPPVRQGRARSQHVRGARLARAFPRASRRSSPSAIRRASPSISTISPTCCRPSPTAASSCRRSQDKNALPRQVMLYREFVRAVFLGA